MEANIDQFISELNMGEIFVDSATDSDKNANNSDQDHASNKESKQNEKTSGSACEADAIVEATCSSSSPRAR